MGTYWYRKQLRILQTVLREKDLEGYDADAVVQYMEKTDANCLVVNAGGVLDFFPNRTEFGRPGRFLADQDILKSLTEKCHAKGKRILVRVDFRGVEKERFERKPDWFGQKEDGSPLMGWDDRIWRPCYHSFYGSGHAEQFIENLLRDYDLDGVWENCVIFGYGPCYCRKCRESYRAFCRKEIPQEGDYASEGFREYREWKAIHAKKHLERMRQAVKRFGEEKAYVSEIFGMYHVSTSLTSGIDLYDAKDQFDFLVTPLFLDGSAQPDKKYEDFSHAASGIRFLKAIAPDRQSVALTGGNGTKWRYVTAPRLETRIWMWEAVSAGGGLWNTYFNGQHPDAAVDRRNAYSEQEIYRYLKENEAFLNGQAPDGEIGIFYSRPTRDVWGKDRMEEDEYGSFIKGVERMLFDCHLPYRFVPDLDFSGEQLQGLKVLVLPNTVCISDGHLGIIREFVENGGGLVASYRTSLSDEKGKDREDFGLKDLFGCSFTGIVRDTRQDSYQKVQEADSPLLKDMEISRTEMIMNEGRTLLCVRQGEASAAVCTYVPPIPNQPPEYAYLPVEDTDYPTVLTGRYGKGRVVYFAGQMDRACFTNGHEDFVNLCRNAVEWAAGGLGFSADAPESVHISLTADVTLPGRKVVSFVNTTSGPFRPVRSLQPVFDVEVRMKAGGLREYKILKEESRIEVRMEEGTEGGGEIRIRIPELREFSAVYLDTGERREEK